MASTPPKIAIVIFIIGDEYRKTFESIFKPNIENYCKKYGYDLHILDKLIREEPNIPRKKFFWQRLLVPSQYMEYDYVVSMDSDIFINKHAPPLPIEEIPIGKVAAVNERKYFNNYEWRQYIQVKYGWEPTGQHWHALSGYDRPYDDHINCGMIIYQPKYHAEPITKLYEDNIDNYMNFYQDDQSVLSVFLIDNDMIHWLDERYNRLWFFWKQIMYPNFEHLPKHIKQLYVENFTHLNYFTHFTSGSDIEYLPV
jgi:hypothetical protein